MRSSFILLVVLLITSPVHAEEPPAAPAATKDAAAQAPVESVKRSLAFLQDKGGWWMREKKCASCHHVPMTIWTFQDAKDRGYAVNEQLLAEMLTWTTATDNAAKLLNSEPLKNKEPGKNKMQMGSVFLALGLNARPQSAPEATAWLTRFNAHAADAQEADGCYVGPDGRPPIFDSKEVATLLVATALSPRGSTATSAPRDKAAEWLKTNKAGANPQFLVFRILLADRLARPKEEMQADAQALLKLQNGDGGFSQTKELGSDAYATGQVIYALALAGSSAAEEPISRAQAFLVKTQASDGSWPMTSRPAKPGGEGAKDLAPITYAATAWATIGLVRSLPEQKPK